ncbi:hypothetical protein QUF72_10520 [Desulfobacterales bacterium HSG2]|nr:hypothetical protein [Desulfobacterales bacterium HSG2]
MMHKTGKPQIIVLCEDRAHWHFIREYLMLRGWNPRKLQPVIAPFGRGAAEQWVRKRYAREVKAYRKKAQYQNIALLVMIDADKSSVIERKVQLNHSQEMKNAGQKRRIGKERIAIFVPKRNIETWFHFLNRESSNEKEDYKPLYRHARPTRYAKMLSDQCMQERIFQSLLPSLQDACAEWQRLVL